MPITPSGVPAPSEMINVQCLIAPSHDRMLTYLQERTGRSRAMLIRHALEQLSPATIPVSWLPPDAPERLKVMLDPTRPVPVLMYRPRLVEIQRQLLGFHAVTLDQGEHSTVTWIQSVLQTLQRCE